MRGMKKKNFIFIILLLFLSLSACNQGGGGEQRSFKLNITKTGQGTVGSSPAGINCGDDCSESFAENTQVTLTATPATGFVFAGWSGDCTGNTVCQVTMNAAKTVTATFNEVASNSFVLNVTKTGQGTVSSSPTGITCGDDCSESFAENTQVTLTATPATGFVFAGWSGDCTGNTPCQVSMTASKNVNANFQQRKQGLLITEVSSFWLELKNLASTPVNLQNYQLRTASQLRVSPYTFNPTPTLFNLPALTIQPNQYVVVAWQVIANRTNGPQLVHVVKDGNTVPAWAEQGFIELVEQNSTVDFVRFGANATAPLSADAWQGQAAVALLTAQNNYGHALARALNDNDTNSASDWTLRNYPTAGGPNDVPPNTGDSDKDGIPDSAEVQGGTFAGLDLFALGARQGVRDIFIEVDYMAVPADAADGKLGMIPQAEALTKVQKAFERQNIKVHFDTGTLYNTLFNLGNTTSEVPYSAGVTIAFNSNSLPAGQQNLQSYKAQYMDIARRNIFHYMLMANSQNPNGKAGSSGLADIKGNDLIVSIGAWGFTRNNVAATNTLINYQAGTIMHELGHNLGLSHAGALNDRNGNYEPNYLSAMNYFYQLYGLPDTNHSKAGDRYYFAKGWKDFTGANRGNACLLHNSPCTDSFVLDYSHGTSQTMDERAVNELAGLGRGNIWVDYNNDGVQDATTYAANINLKGDLEMNREIILSTLTDHDDWGNLFLPFYRAWNGNDLLNPQAKVDPLIALLQQSKVIHEPEPATEFLEHIRRISQ